MMMSATKYLGQGMYTPSEAAMYARVSPQLISRWIHGNRSGAAAIRSQFAAEEKTVTFLDLMQAMAVRAIRAQGEVQLRAIREAVDTAAKRGITYPFARRHTTFIYADRILLKVEDGELIDASGDARGHPNLRRVVEIYMQDVGYGADGLANNFTAREEDGVKIVMSPGYKFGEPVVHPSGISALTLWEACNAEGGIAEAAKAFGVSETEVLVAYRYVDSIRPATAA